LSIKKYPKICQIKLLYQTKLKIQDPKI